MNGTIISNLVWYNWDEYTPTQVMGNRRFHMLAADENAGGSWNFHLYIHREDGTYEVMFGDDAWWTVEHDWWAVLDCTFPHLPKYK
jgi:hypothetical protein